MNCPKCQSEMDSGFAWVNANSISTIEWAKEKPSFSFWKQPKGDVKHWYVNRFNKDNLKKAYQCRTCSILVIENTQMEDRKS